LGDLDILDENAWCAEGTAIEMDGSFQELYKKQFGAPVFHRTGFGAPDLASATWDTLSTLSEVTDVYKAFCFGDERATWF
jgi:hypothetical protein